MSKPTAPPQNPEFRDWALRAHFLDSLRKSTPFQAAARELEAEWNALIQDQPSLSSVLRFRDLSTLEHVDAPLNAYIAKVQNTVANTLRCCIDDAPADWVCQELHRTVCGSDFSEGPSRPDDLHFVADVRMIATTNGVGKVGVGIDNYLVGDPSIIEDPPFEPFTSWKELQKAAYAHVDKALEILKGEMDSATSSWSRHYEKGEKTRREKTMPNLVAWLVEKQEMTYGDRTAVYGLLPHLGLDTPGKS